MKRILLLIAATFAFLSAFSVSITPTQKDADKIVLERISQEESYYTVYAKENLQESMIITTSAGEELALDYPCWVYYISYENNADRYLIVNGSNANVLEVNAKSNATPEDLKKWRVVRIESELGSLQKILDGYSVTAIAFDSKGNAWIATQKGLVRYNANEITIYNSENSGFSGGDNDIAVDKNDNVWIGAGGVWKFDGTEFTFYNSQNTAMPENYVRSMAVDSKNNIWMTSCRFQQGGLVKYDGTEWTVYTPQNSPLPGSLIYDIAIDKSDNVWLAMFESQAYLVKISNDQWTAYYEKDLGFIRGGPIYSIQFDSRNRLWGGIDFTYSSLSYAPPPHFFIFDGNKTTQLSCGNYVTTSLRPKITIDKNDYVWCLGIEYIFGVWINEKWTQFDESKLFGGESVRAVKEDLNGRMWFGTRNGIYIRNNTEH